MGSIADGWLRPRYLRLNFTFAVAALGQKQKVCRLRTYRLMGVAGLF